MITTITTSSICQSPGRTCQVPAWYFQRTRQTLTPRMRQANRLLTAIPTCTATATATDKRFCLTRLCIRFRRCLSTRAPGPSTSIDFKFYSGPMFFSWSPPVDVYLSYIVETLQTLCSKAYERTSLLQVFCMNTRCHERAVFMDTRLESYIHAWDQKSVS